MSADVSAQYIDDARDMLARVVELHARYKVPDDVYTSFEHFLSECGTWSSASALAARDKRRGKLKRCYQNASELVLNGGGRYAYREGIAFSSVLPIPIAHAWVYDTLVGEHLEITWRDAGLAYCGYALSERELMTLLIQRKCYGVLVDRRLPRPFSVDALVALHESGAPRARRRKRETA